MLPSAHRSPQPKRHLHRFGHFCTGQGRVSSGIPGHVLSPKSCIFAWEIWTPSNAWFLEPTRVQILNGISIGSAVFAQITTKCRYTLHRATSSPPLKLPLFMGDLNLHLIHGSLCPPKSSTQTASRSVQPFLHSSPQSVRIVCNICRPFPWDMWTPSNTVHGSLGQPESTTHTASRSVPPFLQGSLL